MGIIGPEFKAALVRQTRATQAVLDEAAQKKGVAAGESVLRKFIDAAVRDAGRAQTRSLVMALEKADYSGGAFNPVVKPVAVDVAKLNAKMATIHNELCAAGFTVLYEYRSPYDAEYDESYAMYAIWGEDEKQ